MILTLKTGQRSLEKKKENSFKLHLKVGMWQKLHLWADDCLLAVAVAKAQPPQDEYETDSEDDFSDTDGEDLRRLQFQDLDGQYAPISA